VDKGLLALLVSLASQGVLAGLVGQALQEIRVLQVAQVLLVLQDRQVFKVLSEVEVSRVLLGVLELLELVRQAPLDMMVLLDILAGLDNRGFQEILAQLVIRVHEDLREMMGRLLIRGQRVARAQQAQQAQLVLLV